MPILIFCVPCESALLKYPGTYIINCISQFCFPSWINRMVATGHTFEPENFSPSSSECSAMKAGLMMPHQQIYRRQIQWD